MPKHKNGATNGVTAETTVEDIRVDTLSEDAERILGAIAYGEMKPKPKPVRQTIVAEHRLTDEEIVAISGELAEAHEEIASLEARMNELVRKIRSRSETREFFCEAELDFDLKIKRWRDVKTWEVVKTEELSARDYQQKLRFEEGVNDAVNTETADASVVGDAEGDDEPAFDTEE